jgi:hypothetical protein
MKTLSCSCLRLLVVHVDYCENCVCDSFVIDSCKIVNVRRRYCDCKIVRCIFVTFL